MSRIDQLRVFLDDYAVVVIAFGVVLAGIGALVVYDTYVGGETETETETVVLDSWEERASFSHAAEVTEPNPVFATGTVLDGRSQYYASVAPTLSGEFTYQHTGEEPRTVSVVITLVMRSVNDDGGVFWAEEQRLNEVEATDVTADEPVGAGFEVNVTAVEERIDEIEDGLGATLGVSEAVVQAQFVADHQGGPRTVDTKQLSIDPGGSVYTVETSEPMERTNERTQEQEVPVERGPGQSLAGPLLLLIGVAIAGGTAYTRRTERLTVPPDQRDRIAFDRSRADLDDWITAGTVPASATSETTVQVDDLEGLVDIAIDADLRVVEDRETGAFYVIDDRITYVFTRERGAAQATIADWGDEDPTDGEQRDQPVDDGDGIGPASPSETGTGDGPSAPDGSDSVGVESSPSETPRTDASADSVIPDAISDTSMLRGIAGDSSDTESVSENGDGSGSTSGEPTGAVSDPAPGQQDGDGTDTDD